MNKFLRYTIRSFAVLVGIALILVTGVFIYVSSHKKDIIEKVKTGLAGKLNGEVQIGNIDLSFTRNFPNVSVLIENVSVKDTMFSQHQHTFLKAEKIYAIIGIGNTLLKNNPLSGIRIENGSLYVYTDTSGYTNSYLFTPKKDTDTSTKKSTAKTEIESIRLNNFRIVLDDQKKKKLYDFEVRKINCKVRTNDSGFSFNMDDEILIHSLAFNTEMGSYVKETPFEGDFKLNFNTVTKQLSFTDIDVSLKKQPFNLSGLFTFSDTPTFTLKVLSKNVDYNLAKTFLLPKTAEALSLVKIDKPIKQVQAEISGYLNGGDPLVKANWILNKTDVRSPFVSLQNCSLEGLYINEVVTGQPRKDPNSRLHFQHLEAEYEGIPVKCENVDITNLIFPILTCDVKANFDLTKLNDLLGSNALTLQSGRGNIDIAYNGPLQDNSSQNTLINGSLTMSDGSIFYKARNIVAKNVNGNILFKNTDVFVTDFKGNVQGNKIMMDGSAKNLLALIKTNPGIMIIDWNIYSPSINLNSFPTLLEKRTATISSTHKSKLGSTARQLDEIVDYSNFRLKLKADELIYSKFKGTNVKAIFSLRDEDWILEKINLTHAGGQMNISGLLTAKSAALYEAKVKVDMDNVDVNKVFYAFNNFGQKGIESDNLKGKLTSSANVVLDINRNTEQPSNINGNVDFSLKNGALLHYEPLKKVQTIIFKKRNFEEIYFAELKDKLDIKNQEITINRMEIQSTALTLFVEGIYSLQGKTDLSIQVPLSNLKKRGEDYTPENKGADSKGGASIFIRGQTGADGVVGFKLDVFKKLRKKKGS